MAKEIQSAAPETTGDNGRALVTFYIAAFAAVVVAAVLLCIFVFFRVEKVEVIGGESYRLRDILTVLDIQDGENLVLLPTAWREEELTRRFPYIKEAKITKHLPSTIQVELTETEPFFSVQSREGYLYVDETGKILEIADYAALGSVTVRGSVATTTTLSEQLTFEDPEITDAMLYIGQQLRNNNITNISSIDLRSRYNVTMTYDLRIVFQLGNLNDMEYKMQMGLAVLTQMLDDGSITGDTRGEIDLTNTDLNFASFRPYSTSTVTGGKAGRTAAQQERFIALTAKANSSEDGDDDS